MRKRITIIILLILSIGFSLPVSANAQNNANALEVFSLNHLKLKGTLFTSSVNPLAIIEDTRNGQVSMYEIGDTVEGVKILLISRGEVTLDGSYKLSFPKGAVWEREVLPESDDWYSIKREGNNIVTDRETVSGALLRVHDIMKDINIRPHSVDGKKIGIRITKLNKRGILKEAGVEEGDIVKSINGMTLNSPFQIFNAYRKLKDKDILSVELVRGSKSLTLNYEVKNSLKR